MKNIYSFWGKRPFLYSLSCVITFLGREEVLRKKAVENLKLRKGDTVIDIACGTGLNFPYLHNAVGNGGKIIGVDYSREMLYSAGNRIKQKGWENVVLKHMNAAEMSLDTLFLEHEVDGILSTLGISAIPDHKQALAKAVEMLKYKGTLVILDAKPFPETSLLRFFNPLIKYIYKQWANWNYEKDIIETLEKLAGKVDITEYNSGTIYIATVIKS